MELMIPLKNQADQPLYGQIYEYIKNEIKKGALPAMTRLPSTRVLADHLKVSRSTTQMAYEQLISEGYIESVPYKGYFVCGIEELVEVDPCSTWTAGESDGGGLEKFDIDFSPRGIDLSSFPFHTWRKLTRNTLVDDNKEMFLTGSHQGEPTLREAVRAYLHSARGVNCTADQIIVGAGSEYLLMLLSQLLGRSRVIAMENPTYKQAYRVLESLGYEVRPVSMDVSGMSREALEESHADTAYVMPSHQYPMGIVMPVKRRQELLSWACRGENRYLIEDDYDSEFRYKGKPIPALQGMDSQGRVIYIGTFSKSIAPAIRVSFMVLPPSLLSLYHEKAGFYASTVSRIDQNVLYQFLAGGYYERHLNRMRTVYKGKHDTLLTALRPLEGRFEIRGEYAGLHLLMTDRCGADEEELIQLAEQKGVRVYGLSGSFIHQEQNTDRSTVLLGYANLTEDEICRGAALLREVWS